MASLLTLTLDVDDPCNTVFADEDNPDVVYYTVESKHEKETTTTVYNGEETVIATWEWRDVQSDIITFPNSKPIPVSSWMHKSLIPFADKVTFKSPNGTEYRWKNTYPGAKTELYIKGDSANPIAQFSRSRTTIKDRNTPNAVEQTIPAKLVVDSRGQEVLDLVIISFLLLERRRRGDENDVKKTTGGGWATGFMGGGYAGGGGGS